MTNEEIREKLGEMEQSDLVEIIMELIEKSQERREKLEEILTR